MSGSTILWAVMAIGGLALGLWSNASLPKGTVMMPAPVVEPVRRGPYRWLAHPMYLGNTLLIAGLAGLAAGFWNALAVGTVAELLFREWAWREAKPSNRTRR